MALKECSRKRDRNVLFQSEKNRTDRRAQKGLPVFFARTEAVSGGVPENGIGRFRREKRNGLMCWGTARWRPHGSISLPPERNVPGQQEGLHLVSSDKIVILPDCRCIGVYRTRAGSAIRAGFKKSDRERRVKRRAGKHGFR